jgi:hypothetical protein
MGSRSARPGGSRICGSCKETPASGRLIFPAGHHHVTMITHDVVRALGATKGANRDREDDSRGGADMTELSARFRT